MKIAESIKELESISSKLEDGNIELEEAVKLFEQGTEIIRNSYSFLKEANGKITIIKQQLDAYAEEKFDDKDN